MKKSPTSTKSSTPVTTPNKKTPLSFNYTTDSLKSQVKKPKKSQNSLVNTSKSTPNSKKTFPWPQIHQTAALTLWVFLSIIASQLLFSILFQFFLGDDFEQPVWATVYSAVYYATSLFLVIYIPARFRQHWPRAILIASILILLYYLLVYIFAVSEYLDSGLFSALGQGIGDFFASFTVMGIICFIITVFALFFAIFTLIKQRQTNSHSADHTPDLSHVDHTPITQPPTREQLGLSGLPTWTDIGLAPIGYIAAILLGAVLTAIFSIFPWFDLSKAQDVGFTNLASALDRLVAFVALVIIAPIAEETIFRGWLYGKLRSFLNLPVAMIIVSLLFGLMHGQWNVGVTVFAMSIVLCFIREITGTIYSGIIMHMIKNGVAFIFLYLVNFS